MKAPNNHKGLQKYRAAKAARREFAINIRPIMAEVASLHPDYSMSKCQAIAEASYKAQQINKGKRNG